MATDLPGMLRHLIFGHFCAKGVRRGLRAALSDPPLGLDSAERRATMQAIDWKAGEIMVSDHMRIIDPPSRGHLEWSAWILAAYQVLKPRFDSDGETIDYLGDASMRGFDTPLMRLGVRLVLRACKGNLGRTKAVLASMLTQYGASFDWAMLEQDAEVDMQISRCFYVDFFRAHDLPQLTTVLCRLDSLWFDRIDSQKHGLRFDTSRYQTMSRGADRCVFPIVEVTVGQSG